MKTKWLLIPMLAVALGCTRETKNDVIRIDGEFTLYAHSGDSQTKTILQRDGSVFWSPEDCIMVYYGDLSGKFTSDNTAPADYAGFTGSLGAFTLDGKTEFMAAYPYSNEISLSGSTFHIDLPAGQEAVEGTFADDLFICVAKSTDFDLYFYNVCGGVKFSVAKEGIKKVVFKGNEGESLAGRLAVGFSDGKPRVEGIDDGKTSVTLTAPDGGFFKQGVFYYMVLAPQSLQRGYTMEFYSDVLEWTESDDSPVTIRRSAWGSLRDLAPQTSHTEVVPGAPIDLGLPSGTKWSPYNVGATKPQEAGRYYAWGETYPKNNYDWSTYLHADGTRESCHDIGTEISGTDYDVARQLWGQNWAMPTVRQVYELMMNCNSSWTTEGGVRGIELTSRINGERIFFPVSGHYYETENYDSERSFFWTGSQDESDISKAYSVLMFQSGETNDASVGFGGDIRCYGCPVRPVFVDYGVPVPEIVDLGLSVKWASFNLGASKPEEYGDYYAWGETEPHYSSQDPLTWKPGEEAGYWWPTYKWCMGSLTTITKYCTDPNLGYDGFVDDKSVLDPDDDAAHVIFGGKWRMPTKEEQDELRDKCSWKWKQVNGKNGYEVTGPNGNSIFLPAAGSRTDTFLHDANTTGTYWSSSLRGSHSAYFISFESDGVYWGGSVRCAGNPIRSVYGDASTTPDIFELSPAEFTVDGDGGEITVDVTASNSYRITSMPNWITELTVGEDTHSHRFKVAANESWQSRSGIIVFSNQKAVNRTVTVRQDGMSAKLVVSPTELSIGGAGGHRSVDVTSNVEWIAVSNQNWCTLAPEDGLGNKTLRIEVSENPGLTPRTATITISAADGTLSRTVLVNQAGNDTTSFNWDKEFYHRSLVLRFTATWCGYCPSMAHSLAVTHEKYPDRFVSVNVHGNGSNLEFSEHGPLSDLFLVTGYPSSYMDFRRKISNYEPDYYSYLFNRYLEEQEENYPAVTTVALESSLSGCNLDVDVTLFVKEEGEYKIAVYLTESGIVGFQADHTDGDRNDYQHNDVVRLSLTDVLGDAISVTSANTRLKRSYSVSIPSGYDRNRLKLLVYVQRAYGSRTRLQDDAFGDYYVDNSVYAEVGRSVPPAVVAGSGGGNEDVTDGKPVNW